MSLACALVVTGCATSPPSQSHAKQPQQPPYADKVQVLAYDTTTRPPTEHLDILGPNPPQRPYKVIALLTCEGAVDQEVAMDTAIYYRARQLGADGVADAGTITTQQSSAGISGATVGQALALHMLGLGESSARSVFRVIAIVYTDK